MLLEKIWEMGSVHLVSSCGLGLVLEELRRQGSHTDTRLVVEGGGEVVAHWPVLARSEAWNSLRRGREGGEEVVVLLPQYTRGEVEEWLEKAYGLNNGGLWYKKEEICNEDMKTEHLFLKEEKFTSDEELDGENVEWEVELGKKQAISSKSEKPYDISFIKSLGLESLVLDAMKEASSSNEQGDSVEIAKTCVDLVLKSKMFINLDVNNYVQMPNSCSLCYKSFGRIDNVIRHIQNHHVLTVVKKMVKRDIRMKARIFKCDLCGAILANKQSLKEHVKNLHSDAPKKCRFCDFFSSDYTETRRHEREIHGTTEKSCHICGTKFKSIQGFETHMENSHGDNTYPCPKCENKYKCKKILDDHIKKKHVEKTECCDECGSKFATTAILKCHKMTHITDPSLFQYSCTICQKRFKHKKDMEDHNNIHTGEKPFHCNDCGMDFRQRNSITRHIRVVHKGLRKFSCNLCRFASGQSHSLTVHYKSVHSMERPKEDILD